MHVGAFSLFRATFCFSILNKQTNTMNFEGGCCGKARSLFVVFSFVLITVMVRRELRNTRSNKAFTFLAFMWLSALSMTGRAKQNDGLELS